MSVVLETQLQSNKINSFQNGCDVFSKQCAVLLGFVVPISTAATHVVLFCLIASWFFAGGLKEKVQFIVNHPVARIAVLLFGTFVIGSLYSDALNADNMRMLEKMGKLLYIPFLLPMLQEEKWRRAAFLAFLSAMLLTLILSLLTTYVGLLPIVTNETFSISCVFKNHIFTNLMMAFASFMVGHALLNQSNFLMRIGLCIFLVSLVFYVLFMSVGRSGYVVFLVLWLLLGLQRLNWKALCIGILGLGLVLGFAYFNSVNLRDRIAFTIRDAEQYTAGNSKTSIGERLEFYTQTWQLSKQRLWFGYGTGSFQKIYQNHSIANHLIPTRNPHSEYLNILFQLGLFGVTAFMGFFLLLFKWSFALPRIEKWVAQGVILSMAVGCFANSWLMDVTSGYFFVMFIAFCFGALNLKKGSVV